MARHMNTSSEQRLAFGLALEAAMAAAEIQSTAELHRRGILAGMEKTQSSFAHWIRGESEPSRPEVLTLEEICDVEPGTLSRHLGWIPLEASTDVTIEEAVLADPSINAANKAILLGLITQLRD